MGRRPKLDATSIPQHIGKIVIVTGVNVGIGVLVRKGEHVILACRTESKGHDAVKRAYPREDFSQ